MFSFDFFKQKSPQQRFLFILGLFMLLFYLGVGLILLFRKDIIPLQIGDTGRIAFAVLLMGYSLVRFGRLIKQTNEEV